MSWMAGGTKFLLWFMLLTSSQCSDLDVQCLKIFQQSVIDPRDILASSWRFDDRDNSYKNYICSFTGIECWSPVDNRVLSLRLSDMGLQGQFPRGLEHCTSLVSLDLSGNNFSGSIPSDIARNLPYLASLNLSGNIFSGEIPLSISNMVYLNDLYLQRNQLSGQIPGEISLLDRLISFNVADNLLSGPIPSALQKFPASTFVGNQELCGAPLEVCPRKRKLKPKINDESIIGAAAGFVMGFLAAFYFSHVVVFSKKLHPYFHMIRFKKT